MIIDCHFHLEERLLSRDRLLAKMDESGIDKTALMAAMVDPFPEPPPALLRLLQFFLVHRSLRWAGRLSAARFSRSGGIKMPGGSFSIYPDPDNSPVFEAVAAHPDRFLGWIFVNPEGKIDPVAEFKRWQDHPGVVGVKAHPFWHRYEPVKLVPVARLAAEAGLPLLIHAGFGAHGDFFPLLRQIPGLKLILAHAGFPFYRDIWPKIADYRNVWVDLSQTSYVNEKITRQVVDFLGPDRCLYGTDGPFGFHDAADTFDMTYIKRRIEMLFSDKRIQQKLLGGSFAACAGL